MNSQGLKAVEIKPGARSTMKFTPSKHRRNNTWFSHTETDSTGPDTQGANSKARHLLSNNERMDNIIANISPNGQRHNVQMTNPPDNIFEQDLLSTDIVYKTGKIGAANGTEAMMVV